MKVYLLAIFIGILRFFIIASDTFASFKELKAGQYILGYVKEHKDKGGTPTMGGLAVISSIIIVGLGVSGIGDGKTNLTLAITAGFTVVGFLDDFLKIYRKDNGGLKPYQKILFQLAISAIAAAYCYVNELTVLFVPFGGGLSFDIGWGIIPLVIFVFIASVNCVNLTDGLDGLAGGTSLAFLFVLGIMLSVQNSGEFGSLFLSVSARLVPFFC